VKAINVGELDEMLEKFQPKEEEGKIFVDLEKFGVTKLLGAGKVSKPLIVKVASCSKSAAEKIKEAGGQILIESQEEAEQ
jgi:large subunit ribosomal protein L15